MNDNKRYPLFEHMSSEHGLLLLDSEMDEIIDICTSTSNGAEEGSTASANGDAGLLYATALDLRQCASSWESDARLVGSVKAGAIVDMCTDYVKLRLQAGI